MAQTNMRMALSNWRLMNIARIVELRRNQS
jgi:hypothetical protein